MTILPELRDDLARRRPILPELRDGLVTARRRRHRRPVLVTSLAVGTLLATGGALAATGVIGIGDPVEPKYINRDPQRGVGVPADRDARLLGLRVADPDGGPPWGLRLAKTSRGMLCLQIGRVVDDRLGVLGSDRRLHPLPAAAAANGVAPCVPPDGAGRFFTAVDRTSSVTGVLRVPSCREPGERRRLGRPLCPPDESRHVAYGLLGPEAASVSFADGSRQELTAPEGAYLFVRERGTRDTMVAMGGGPAVQPPFSAVTRVDYRDGTSCPSKREQYSCPPKGYVEPRGPAKGVAVRRPLKVSLGRGKYGPEVRVSFRAPMAITQARDIYLLEGRVPGSPIKQCRHVVLFAPSVRNVARGERVRLTGMVPKRCTGKLVARVLLADIAYGNGKGPAATVGRFTRTIR